MTADAGLSGGEIRGMRGHFIHTGRKTDLIFFWNKEKCVIMNELNDECGEGRDKRKTRRVHPGIRRFLYNRWVFYLQEAV